MSFWCYNTLTISEQPPTPNTLTMSEQSQTPALRVPPYSEEAERGVLGSILLDAARVLDLCVENGLATPESFYVPAHRTLYGVLQQMSSKGEVVDMLTVLERLRAEGLLDGVGGAGFLEKLVDATPTAAHAEYYIDIVRQKALLRRALDCVREVERECYEQQAPADQIVAESEQKFLAVADNRSGGRVSWKDTLVSTFGTIERILRGGVSGISTGFTNLDAKMRGLHCSGTTSRNQQSSFLGKVLSYEHHLAIHIIRAQQGVTAHYSDNLVLIVPGKHVMQRIAHRVVVQRACKSLGYVNSLFTMVDVMIVYTRVIAVPETVRSAVVIPFVQF